MSRQRRREGASNCVEHHFSQVDQPMSKFGMHFYGMGGRLYTCKYGQLSVCITDCPYRRSVFQIRSLSEFELMFPPAYDAPSRFARLCAPGVSESTVDLLSPGHPPRPSQGATGGTDSVPCGRCRPSSLTRANKEGSGTQDQRPCKGLLVSYSLTGHEVW